MKYRNTANIRFSHNITNLHKLICTAIMYQYLISAAF